MFQYFDKAFFRFTRGFIALLALSFAVFLMAGYYQGIQGDSQTACCEKN